MYPSAGIAALSVVLCDGMIRPVLIGERYGDQETCYEEDRQEARQEVILPQNGIAPGDHATGMVTGTLLWRDSERL